MDIIWQPNPATDNIVWANCEGTINGFADLRGLLWMKTF